MADEAVVISVKVDDLAAPAIKRIRRETEELGDAFEKAGKQTGRARGEQGRFIKGAGQGADTLGVLKHAMVTVGFDRLADAALAAGAALVRYAKQGVLVAVQANAELEQSIQDAVAISGGSYEDLEEAAVSAGMAAAFSAKQAGDALGFLAQAGFAAEEATTALPGVLDLASAGSLDLARAADIASNALSGFGLGVDELGRVNDVLAKTAASSNTNVEQLGQALKQVAPLAVASSQSLESVSAAIGILGNAGIQATQGGTMLRGALAALQKPSGEAAGVIDSLGVSVNDVQGQMRPLIDVLGDLGKAGATNADLITIFGRETIAGVSALSQATDQWAVAIGEAESNSAGFAKEVANLKLDTIAGQYQILTGSVETYAARLGQTLNPGLKEAALATNAVLAESKVLDAEFDRLAATVMANKEAFSDLAISGLVVLATAAKSTLDVIDTLGSGVEKASDLVDRAAKAVGFANGEFGDFGDKATTAAAAAQAFGHVFFSALTLVIPPLGILGNAVLAMSDLTGNAAEAAGEISAIDENRRMLRVAEDTRTAAETFDSFVANLKEYPALIAKGVEETVKQRIEEERIKDVRLRNSKAALKSDIAAAKASDELAAVRHQREAALSRVRAQALASDVESLKLKRTAAEFDKRINTIREARAKQSKAEREEAERKSKAEREAALALVERNALAEYQLEVVNAEGAAMRAHAEYALELQRIEQESLTELERAVALREAEIDHSDALREIEASQLEIAIARRKEREAEAAAAMQLGDAMSGVSAALAQVRTGASEIDGLASSFGGLLDGTRAVEAAEEQRYEASLAQIFGEADALQQQQAAKEATIAAEMARANAIVATGDAVATTAGALGASAQAEAAIQAAFNTAASVAAFASFAATGVPSFAVAGGQYALSAGMYAAIAGGAAPSGGASASTGGGSSAGTSTASAPAAGGVDINQSARIQAEALADVLEERRSGDTVINITVRDSVVSNEQQAVELLDRGYRRSSLGRRLNQ